MIEDYIKWLEENTAFSVLKEVNADKYVLLRRTLYGNQTYGDFNEQELRDFIRRLRWNDPGKPCSHKGCLHHVTHPCENCGRTGGLFPEQIR